uniref:Protein kinase domain-containing protein n=1 Tax=Oryzias melastigma TaxID=30732 RepID=A0A3B3BYR6_ORYME
SILYPRTCEFHYAQCEKPVSLENIENTEGLQTDRDQEKMSSKIEEEDKSFVVKTGQSLEGHLGTYEVGELLGKGSYGRVFKCYKVGSEEIVAIKILENVKEGREEFKAMKLIKDLDPDQNNLMKFHECFSYNNATCLVYEILYVSLQMCLSKTHFHLFQIRAFAQQMFQALSALKSIGVVHGDIKLDNILLVKSKSLRIKLIDFGFAKKANKLLKGTEIQITPFRAPEVILGLPLDESIDMWAVGSVLACLYNRGYLFPCDTEYETIRAMVLPTADEYTQNTRKQVKDHVVDLDAIIQVHQDRFDDHDDDDHRVFIDLLKRMLEVNPQNRITPIEFADGKEDLADPNLQLGLFAVSVVAPPVFAQIGLSGHSVGRLATLASCLVDSAVSYRGPAQLARYAISLSGQSVGRLAMLGSHSLLALYAVH